MLIGVLAEGRQGDKVLLEEAGEGSVSAAADICEIVQEIVAVTSP